MSTSERDRGRGGERSRSRRLSSDRGLSAMLALLVVLIFVIQPLGELGVAGRVITSLFFSLMLISGVWTVSESPVPAAVVAALVLMAVILRWLRLWFASASLALSSALTSYVFCLVVAAVVLAQVFREGRITVHRIQGAIAAYLLIGMAWAFAYELVAVEWPNAFALPTAMPRAHADLISHFVYFSFVTLTTVGFGDVTAIHPVARSLVTIEALIGQLFPAILLARLVSMEVAHREPVAHADRTRR